MLHFSCDMCGKDLTAGISGRYVVKLEVYAAHDPSELTEADLDADHLEAIGQMLSDEASECEPAPAFKKMRYDLCSGCHQKFLADPLGRDAQKFEFSPN